MDGVPAGHDWPTESCREAWRGQAREDLNTKESGERAQIQVKAVCSSQHIQSVEGSRAWPSCLQTTGTLCRPSSSDSHCVATWTALNKAYVTTMLTKAELGGDAAIVYLQLTGVSSYTTVLCRVNSSKLYLRSARKRQNTAVIFRRPQ